MKYEIEFHLIMENLMLEDEFESNRVQRKASIG